MDWTVRYNIACVIIKISMQRNYRSNTRHAHATAYENLLYCTNIENKTRAGLKVQRVKMLFLKRAFIHE